MNGHDGSCANKVFIIKHHARIQLLVSFLVRIRTIYRFNELINN